MPSLSPQRALREPRPAQLIPRATNTAEHHARLAARLTPRDRWLARILYEHRVLTASQIDDALFGNRRVANRRLRMLYEWRIVDRFRPFTTRGTAPLHYVLDDAGATMLAHEDDLNPKTLGYRHVDAIGIAHSLTLAHTLGVNGFFCDLIATARCTSSNAGDSRELRAWWSEARCAHHFGDIVRPDAYGQWRHTTRHEDTTVEFFLEYDTGTETLARLAAKIFDYHRLCETTGITTPVLFLFASADREEHARRVLTDAVSGLAHPHTVPVATCTATPRSHTDRRIERDGGWRPLHTESPMSLADLTDTWPELEPPAAALPGPIPATKNGRPRPAAPMPPKP